MWHDVKCEGQERATEMENEKQKLPNNLIRKFGQLQLAPFTLTEEGGKGERTPGGAGTSTLPLYRYYPYSMVKNKAETH